MTRKYFITFQRVKKYLKIRGQPAKLEFHVNTTFFDNR